MPYGQARRGGRAFFCSEDREGLSLIEEEEIVLLVPAALLGQQDVSRAQLRDRPPQLDGEFAQLYLKVLARAIFFAGRASPQDRERRLDRGLARRFWIAHRRVGVTRCRADGLELTRPTLVGDRHEQPRQANHLREAFLVAFRRSRIEIRCRPGLVQHSEILIVLVLFQKCRIGDSQDPGRVVRTASVQKMQQLGIEKIVELGPGKVLAGLTRRIDRSLSASAVIDTATLHSTIEEIR